MMFIRVDLPAPFSPSRPSTCPLCSARSMWSLASTPGKRRVSPRTSSTGVASSMASGSDVCNLREYSGLRLARTKRAGSVWFTGYRNWLR